MKKSLLSLAILIVGIGIGMAVDHTLVKQQVADQDPSSNDAHQVRQGGYSLINPLLECEVGSEVLTKQFVSFKYKIENEVNKLKASGDASDMSVYFRDLNNGVGFGVNQNEGFTPASLLKVPVMMAYYKQSESEPTIMQKKLKYDGGQDRNEGETVKPTSPMKPNQQYTVEDLIYRMIVFSDNNAMALLVENLPLPIQDKVYKDLGISIPGVRGTEDYMSVTDNASFFRILYNASYLTKDNSQKALDLLSKVDFTDGIRAGVPSSVKVANKFGEREVGNIIQLHDCGIVYFKDHPYLLCIMSRGTDFTKLAASIKNISRLVYLEVNKQVRL